MACKMKDKCDKYWGDPLKLNVMLFLSTVLDHRYKWVFVELVICQMYEDDMGLLVCKRGKKALKDMYSEYKGSQGESNSTTTMSGSTSSGVDGESSTQGKGIIRARFKKLKATKDDGDAKIELDKYLNDALEEDVDDFDILKWWKTNSGRYPTISSMARDVLAIPVKTVASESAFSTGGRVLDQFRSSLSPKVVEALICTQDWLRASPHGVEELKEDMEKLDSGLDSPINLEEFYYPQPLDHLGDGNMSTLMFNQRYIVDRKFWAGPNSNSPLLVYFGGESSLINIPENLGIIKEAASRFGALIMYIEHRFCGKSIPFGSIDISMEDEEVRGCLTSEQALMDFAEILMTTKKNLLGPKASIIVFGCSYSGMLAAWFRLKFPHIATGALASSAPIFFFDMDMQWENKFCEVVSHDYKAVNEECYYRIKLSWDLFNNISKETYGLDKLEKMFNTCSPLLTVHKLTSSLVTMYSKAAQYNGRFNTFINGICDEIVRAPDSDILGAISRVARAASGLSCYELDYSVKSIGPLDLDENSLKAWSWQVCNEFVMRWGCSNGTMFQPSAYNLSETIDYCTNKYNVRPALHRVSTYYGGYDLRYSLRNFASNMILSNGLMDPFSAFGLLEDLSETVVAISTKQGSHCLDFPNSKADDPKWLRKQREEELKLLARWIQEKEHLSGTCQTNPQQWFVGLGFNLLLFALFV